MISLSIEPAQLTYTLHSSSQRDTQAWSVSPHRPLPSSPFPFSNHPPASYLYPDIAPVRKQANPTSELTQRKLLLGDG